MIYRQELIDVLSDLACIQSQIILKSDENETFTIKANDHDASTCFILNAPKSYFNFPSNEIAFFDYTLFKKYFNIFNKATKDPATTNKPLLEIETNNNSQSEKLIISSSIDDRKFITTLGDPAVVTKPQFNKIVFPSVDAQLSLSSADVADLQSMINIISADVIKFTCKDSTCTIELTSNFTGDKYSTTYNLTEAIQVPFEICTPKTGIVALPKEAYNVRFCSRGLIEFKQLREDDINLTIYVTKGKK